VIKNEDTPQLKKYSSAGEVSEEEIMTHGLAAAIPWRTYNLSGKTRRLEIIEHQYISLTEGDMIATISKNGVKEELTSQTALLNDWQKVSSAEYRFAEDSVNTALPEVEVPGMHWNARSRLDFNMSQTTPQILHIGDKFKINFKKSNPLELTPQVIDGVALPMYINSNYTCQAATDTLNAATFNEAGLALKLKLTAHSAPASLLDGSKLALDNYVNGEAKYTKFDFASTPEVEILSESDWLALAENAGKTSEDYEEWKELQQRTAFSLNTSIPEPESDQSTSFGLMMIYYSEDTTDAAKDGYSGAFITASGDEALSTTSGEGITLFNKDFAADGKEQYYITKSLNKGINIIKLTPEVKKLNFYTDSAKKGSVVFGGLDLITGINPKLDYRNVDNLDSNLDQLLADIRALGIADEFYYTVPIQKASEIDLNAAVESDKLSSPMTWYDPNNVNRKFVVSEIDAEYLSTGITLTKASRV
jgi:hypothetical protein